MNRFHFHQDVKCSIWHRQYFSIEAESLDEARRIAVQYRDKDISRTAVFERSEQLTDTEELMLPSDSQGGQSTMQLYAQGDEYPFATNADDGVKQLFHQFDRYLDAREVARREMAGYTAECTCGGPLGLYQAFHKNDCLVILLLVDGCTSYLYDFGRSWDQLVNHDVAFRKGFSSFIVSKYKKNIHIQSQVRDWLSGHLTEMTAGGGAVDNSVPFTLADLIEGGSSFAAVRQFRPAALIGYQVASDDGEMPDGLFSFQVIRDLDQAESILEDALAGGATGLAIHPVYEGDIEEPSFV